jgi:hypothetical protein
MWLGSVYCCVLQKVLAGMRDRGATAAVVEVDAEAQATGCLQWVEPTIAVFTNLGEDTNSMFSSKEVGSSDSSDSRSIGIAAFCLSHRPALGYLSSPLL